MLTSSGIRAADSRAPRWRRRAPGRLSRRSRTRWRPRGRSRRVGWPSCRRVTRWAPGYANKNHLGSYGVSSLQSGEPAESPDGMDLVSADPRLRQDSDPANDTYNLFPLVFSSGPDGVAGIASDFSSGLRYRDTGSMSYHAYGLLLSSDPFVRNDSNALLGQVTDPDNLPIDNIFNHNLDTKL